MIEQSNFGSNTIRVQIVGEIRLIRDGLASLLSSSPDITVEGTQLQGTDFHNQHSYPIDVVLAVSCSHVAAEDIIWKVKNAFPSAKAIIIGESGTEKECLEYIEAGASGYVLPESGPEYLIETIQKVCHGEASCPPDILAHLFERVASLRVQLQAVQGNQLNNLTQRELEVLQLVVDGMSNKEISVHLKLELQTVKNHLHNILEKLRVVNRREAVAYSLKFGLLVNRGMNDQHQPLVALKLKPNIESPVLGDPTLS